MSVRRELHYQGYLLKCGPMVLADGRFGAHVAITLQTVNSVIEKGYPSLEAFADEDDAIEYAKRWGKAWIDDNE